ncbi:MAG: C25 family cysteine peptidase [Ignavibacteria bacterium]|nr:C25 family cysteine peptidase [Ignavibacteria bacterium]
MKEDFYKITLLWAVLLLSFYNIFCQTPQEELSRLVESYKIPENFRWYRPEQKYVRLTTTEDKLYFVLSDSIFLYEPSFLNKPLKYFHLLKKGSEIPIYVISKNDLLDEGDTIIFIGSRPVGDTTWFDPYSSVEPYFLMYDESFEGLRLGTLSFPNSNDGILNSINVSYHFEEHHQYSIGQPEHSSQTVNGEGWVWELLSPSDDWIKQDKFSFSKRFFPSEFADSTLFRFFAFSAKFDSNNTKHNISIIINGDTVKSGLFPGGKNILIDFKYPSAKLLLDSNILEIVSRGTRKPDGNLALPDVIGFQYLEYYSKDIPFAQNGFVSFRVTPDNSSKSLKIHNFRTSKVVVTDTTNKKIIVLNAKPEISFWAMSYNKRIRINFADSLLTSNQKGLHLAIFDSISNSITYLFYPEESTKIISDLRNLSTNSVYLAVFNGGKVNNEVANFFRGEGSIEINRAMNGYVWMFAKKVGEENKFETYGNTAKVSMVGSFAANYSKQYSLLINLPIIQNDNHYYISDLKSLEIVRLRSVSISNLFGTNLQADVIVITPRVFKEIADKYIEYRKTTNPEKTFYLAFVEDIFKEFNYGKKSPEAVKRFLVWAYYKWQKPRPSYVVILGDASRDPRNVLSGSIYKDFVPTFGYPATDVWYSFLEGNDFIPDIHIGRIPITSIQEGFSYLDKIREYDSALTAPWMKKFLFLSGGSNELEREYFYDRLKGDFADFILNTSPICVRTQVIRKSDAIVGSEADASFIRAAINEGVQFMIFAGHGSARVFDTDGWKVQTLNNKGKYGFFASFSCNTANFAEPSLVSRNEEYVTYPEKGFVGTFGSGGVGLRLHSLLLATYLLESIADSNVKTDYIIDLIDLAKTKMIRGYIDFENILTIYHYIYLGDPLLRMKIRRKPDLYFIDNKVEILNESGKSNFSQSDSLFIIKGEIGNIGFSKRANYTLWVIHRFNDQTDTLKRIINNLCTNEDFQFQFPIARRVGIHNFQILINPEKKVEEYDFSNNSLSINVEVFASSLFPVEPLSNWNVSVRNPHFRFVDPNFQPETDTYQFSIYKQDGNISSPFYSSKSDEIDANTIRIDWKPEITLPENNYLLVAQKFSKDPGVKNQTLIIPFHSKNAPIDTVVSLLFSTKEEIESSNFSFINLDYDNKTKAIRFRPLAIPYKIMSCSGNSRSERGKEITVNNKVYVTMAPDLDIVGFHVIIISHKDFSLEKYVIFETWGTEPPEKDSSSIHLVKFLRDSVPDRDYIFIVAHNSALRVPIAHQLANPKSPGSLDTLRQAFREWGSKYADSLGANINLYGNSFFMVGRLFNGKKFLIDEGFDLDGDTVESQGFLYQIPFNAKLSSPILGPSKKWKFLDIGIESKDSTITYLTKIYGITSPFDNQKELIAEFRNVSQIDISAPELQKFPYLQFETSFANSLESNDLSIRKFLCNFIPTTEIAIHLDKPFSKNIDTLRGEEVEYIASVHNLSLRTTSDSTFLFVYQKSVSQDIELNSIRIKPLSPNESYINRGSFLTDKFDTKTKILFTIRQKMPELYQFNNNEMLDFYVREDSEKPVIVLYLDGMKIKGGEYVSKKPKVYIEIFDNSRLPFERNNTTLLINIKKIDLQQNAQYVSYEKNVPLKCTFTLESDELEYGLNHFTIYTSDPTGNRDTLDVPVYVARKAKIQNYSVGPNPTKEGLTFYLNYISPKTGGIATVDIYDVVGNKIKTITKQISLNEDYLYWDGLDFEGRSVSQGIYYYKINVTGEIYSEPVFGKFIKIR